MEPPVTEPQCRPELTVAFRIAQSARCDPVGSHLLGHSLTAVCVGLVLTAHDASWLRRKE